MASSLSVGSAMSWLGVGTVMSSAGLGTVMGAPVAGRPAPHAVLQSVLIAGACAVAVWGAGRIRH
ncbi:MAG: hypothetical protein L0J08_09770 [Micrococcaceae bacterium]|nr:hypothetical protein [Micrococcaceae bacterium]